jgi:hypothetical protein
MLSADFRAPLRTDANRRDGRVVEGARLESVYRGNSIEGSNPSLSAIMKSMSYSAIVILWAKVGQPSVQ